MLTKFTRSTSGARRAVASGLAIVATVALLAGCAGGSSGSATLDKKANVSLTMWTGQDAAAEKLIEKLAAKFEKLHPNVSLTVSPGASSTEDLLQKLSASFAGGNYPDM
jgi:multiple sugar transport system substrate-binding protein